MINVGDVYYSPQTNAFFQVRGVFDDYILCGDMAKYYNDAKSCLPIQQLSREFILNSKKVVTLDTIPEIEFDFTVYDWKVKENKKISKTNWFTKILRR